MAEKVTQDGKYSFPKHGEYSWPANIAHCSKCNGRGWDKVLDDDEGLTKVVCQSCGGTGHVTVMIVRERPEGT